MDFMTLNEIANNLIAKEYTFYLSDSSVINLLFKKSDFQHLLGFQYLTKAHDLFARMKNGNDQEVTKTNILDKLVEMGVDYDVLCEESKIPEDLQPRINGFTNERIFKMLETSYTLRVVSAKSRGITEKAEFILHRKEALDHYHLYMGLNSKGYYYPLSFQVDTQKDPNTEKRDMRIMKIKIAETDNYGNVSERTIDHEPIFVIQQLINKEVSKYNKLSNSLYNKQYDSDKLKQVTNELHKVYANLKTYYNQFISFSTDNTLDEVLIRYPHNTIEDFVRIVPEVIE